MFGLKKMTKFDDKIQDEEYGKPYHWMYDKNLELLYNLRSKIIFKMLGKVSYNVNVLDYGCGDGRFTALLAEKKYRVTGADISEKAINFARCLAPQAKFIKINKGRLPFNDNSFDIVFSLDVLEHLSSEEVKNAVSEISRVLKRKGVLIVSAPSQLEVLIDKHYQHFTPELFQYFLKDCFIDLKFKGILYKPPFLPYALVLKLFNVGTFWKAFSWMVAECEIKRALRIICKCVKKD